MLVTLLPAIALIAVAALCVAVVPASRVIALLPAYPPISSSLESL